MSEKNYRIGEAAAKLDLKTYVLRFWEMEFPQIEPIRTEKGQRLYTETHLSVLRRIRYLLHERGLTIEGARRLLREEALKGVAYDEKNIAESPDVLEADDTDMDSVEAPAPAERPVQDTLLPLPENSPSANAPQNPALLRDIIDELAAIKGILNPEA